MNRFYKYKLVFFIIAIILASTFLLSSCALFDNTKNITFMNGKSEYSQTTFDGNELILPESPKKHGHIFIGWFFDDVTFQQELTVEALKEKNEQSEITVYAKFEFLEHKICYVDGATHSNPEALSLNDSFTLLEPKRRGYTFNGWFTDKDYTTPITELFSSVPKVTTVYAKWTPVEYLATFKSNGITVRTVAFNIETSAISEPPLPEIAGYVGKWEEYTLSPQNITVNAEYKPIVYKITYQNAFGTSNPNPTEYTIESSTIKLSDVKKGGLKFEGWYVGNTLMEEIPAGSYGDIILVAKWNHFMVY